MSIRNIELQTESLPVTSDTSQVTIGGQVASGMKRWVTFVAMDGNAANRVSTVRLYLASVGVSNPTRASIVATSNRKMLLDANGTQLSRSSTYRPIIVPVTGPNPDTPLFSIAGGKWLGAYASLTTANVFVQYYDE